MPASIWRGSRAPVGFPKFGDDITPDILPTLVRLNAFVMFAKTFRFVRAPLPFPLLFGGAPKKNAFDTLKLKVRVFGPLPLFRGTPGGRSLTTPSLLSSLPVVTLYQLGPAIDIVPVKKIPEGSRAFTVPFTLCVGQHVPWEPT